MVVRDRPFNLQGGGGGAMGFFSFRIFFFGQHESQNFFFSQNVILGYMTKTLNQIFFSSTKIRIFFQQHWESEYFFRKKTITPPSPLFKLNDRSLTSMVTIHGVNVHAKYVVSKSYQKDIDDLYMLTFKKEMYFSLFNTPSYF